MLFTYSRQFILAAAVLALAGGVTESRADSCSASASTLISRSTGGNCAAALSLGDVFTLSYRITNASIIDDPLSLNDGDPVDAVVLANEVMVATLAQDTPAVGAVELPTVLEMVPVCPVGSIGGALAAGEECNPMLDQCGSGVCGCESALPGVTCTPGPANKVSIEFGQDTPFLADEEKTVATIRVKVTGVVSPPAICGEFFTRLDSVQDILMTDDPQCDSDVTANAEASADLHAPECASNADCDDGDPCTADLCTAENLCSYDYICGADICRSPGYWATHSGYEKKNSVNVGQLVIDAVGPLEVCGESIDSTSNESSPYLEGLGLSSDLEGLCVKTRGIKERSLYRQLVAAALNCGISGGDCDDILAKYVDVSFSDCSDLCAGNPPVDGPTVSECVSQLDCFNNGGQLIDGDCAYGTCAEDPTVYCGGDYGDCPLFLEEPQECEPFPGNCHSAALCNEALGVCPKNTPASSSSACREARGNSCTIDSCED